jgi:hypothetical protein
MKYAITMVPDIEAILTEDLKGYLYEDVKLKSVFPNVKGGVRVSPVHPFAYLIDQQVNGTRVPVDLFPSLTVIVNQDSKAAQIGIVPEDAVVGETEIAHIIANRGKYIISDDDVAALQAMVDAGAVNAVGMSTLRTAIVSLELWADNVVLKNRIFDLAEAYLFGMKRYELYSAHDVRIAEESVTGNRSGNYNFDFGKVYYGGMIQFSLDYQISQYFVDTEIGEYSIRHTVEDIYNGEEE